MGRLLSGLNGKAELSDSTFPLWGPRVATALMTTHTYMHIKVQLQLEKYFIDMILTRKPTFLMAVQSSKMSKSGSM